MSDALRKYYKWAEEQETYDPEPWDMLIALAQEIERLEESDEDYLKGYEAAEKKLYQKIERLQARVAELEGYVTHMGSCDKSKEPHNWKVTCSCGLDEIIQ